MLRNQGTRETTGAISLYTNQAKQTSVPYTRVIRLTDAAGLVNVPDKVRQGDFIDYTDLKRIIIRSVFVGLQTIRFFIPVNAHGNYCTIGRDDYHVTLRRLKHRGKNKEIGPPECHR